MPSLQARMFLVFALIATLPLMALSYLALAETRSALADEVGRSHEVTAKAAAAFVGVYVENGKSLVSAQSQRVALRDAINSGSSTALRDELLHFRSQSVYEGTPIFLDVILLDGNGTVVIADPATAAGEGESFATSLEFRRPVQTGRIALLGVASGGEPNVPISAPVYANGSIVGVIVTRMGLEGMGAKLQAFALGKAEGVVLADQNGRLLVHPDATVLRLQPDWADVPPIRDALATGSGHSEFTDPITGQATVGGYAPVPGLGWVVLDEVPTSEAYAALTRLSAVLIVLSGFLVGAILLASVVLARRIVKPVRELTTAAQALAAGRLGARIIVKGRDEIGELGRTFNEMATRISESLDGIRRSEARYRNLVESANDVILTVESDGALSFAGPLAERLLGFDATDLQGRQASSLLPADDRAEFEASIKTVMETGTPVLWVLHRVIARDGSVKTFRSNFSPIFGADGASARVLVVSRDITTQRRQERFRENSFQMARLVSEETELDALARDGLAIALSSGPHPRGAIHTGSVGDLRQAAIVTQGETFDPERARRLAQRAVITRAPVRDGTAVAVPLLERNEAVGAIVVDDDGDGPVDEDVEVLSTLGSQLAVGIRRSLFEARLKEYAASLETRVEERTAELQAKSEEMESFLYSVSHDLKAPLISIEGYAQSLLEDYGSALAGEGSLYLERIRKNATLMETLILDILELSRIGRIREQVEDVDMDALLGDLAARMEDRFQSSGGRLEIARGLPRVHGERNRIAQLFTNLIENGLKYRHPTRPPLVRVDNAPSENGTIFRVLDNGRGIPPGSADQLFKIFQRLPTPDGMVDPGGTGMGLAIVKRIVDTHGGRIWMESPPEAGTVFFVELPAAQVAQERAQ